MPASTVMPTMLVEMAFGSGYATPAGSRSWTDISDYVELQYGLNADRGRGDEFSDVQPGRLTMTLDNKDGRFTPGYASGAYYPNILKGVPVRVSATWPIAAGTTYRIYLGYVDEWPVVWPRAVPGSSVVTVTASTRSAQFSRMNLAARVSDVVAQEILYDSPIAYFPLGEPTGSTSAVNSAATAQPNLGVRGGGSTAPAFGVNAGPAASTLTAALFTYALVDSGQYLYSSIPPTTSSVGDFAVECWFRLQSGTPGAADIVALRAGASGNFGFASDGTLGANIHFKFQAVDLTVAMTADNITHHLVGTRSGSTLTFYVDGVSVGSSSDGTAVTLTDVTVGRLLNGDVSHVAYYSSSLSAARVAQHYLAGSTGFVGETSDARIKRIAGYVGVPLAEISTETGATTSMSAQNLTDQTVGAALLDVVHTENGVLFDAGDGTLTFHARSHRYSQTAAMTLSASTKSVESDLVPKLDDFGVANDVTTTPASAIPYRAVNATSVAAYGTYASTVELLTTSDYEAVDRANFMLTLYSTPSVRMPTLRAKGTVLGQANSADLTSLLALEIGSKITVSGLPSNAPASSMSFFIEGISYRLAQEDFEFAFNLSPTTNLDFWKLGDATYGLLGTTTVLGY